MPISVFLSTVSDEFKVYRDQLKGDLTRHNVAVKVQEDFKGLGSDTLDKLDTYIAQCDAVVHLLGEMCGSTPGQGEQRALLAKHPDMPEILPPLDEALKRGELISYTQWEAWLALYHNKVLLTAKAEPAAPRGPKFTPTDETRAAQSAHIGRLEQIRRYPDCTFRDDADLARHIAYTAILDLLVKDYAREAARARDVAEGFIREMAGRVVLDKNLDFEGMKQAIRTAIDIYKMEISGDRTKTNLGEIIDQALTNAKRLADDGKQRLARASLRMIAANLRRDEDDRRVHYLESVRTLYSRESEIALAAYDGEAAADAIVAMAEVLLPDDANARHGLLIAEGAKLREFGKSNGSSVHLIGAIVIYRAALSLAITPNDVVLDGNAIGVTLHNLGLRENDTSRHEQALLVYQEAIRVCPREREPLLWAMTLNNIGNTLWAIGERTDDMEILERAVRTFEEALKEFTRERAPLDWAMTLGNQGLVLWAMGERETGSFRLEQSILAFRQALEECTREHAPNDWATIQNNLGNALQALGEREKNEARMVEAVTAYEEALKETAREKCPIAWATTHSNLGISLISLGTLARDKARIQQAICAFRSALIELTADKVPYYHDMTEKNLKIALEMLRTH